MKSRTGRPSVSVITTVFNGQEFVNRSLTSILCQTFSDFQYVIVDDGSTDGSLNRISSFDDPRIEVIRAGRVGRGHALNLGLGKSKGRYIAIHDIDDQAHPQRLQMQVKCLEQHKNISVLGTGIQRIWNQDNPKWDPIPGGTVLHPALQNVTRRLAVHNPIRHSSALIRRSMLCRVNGYDARRANFLDWDLFVRVMKSGGECWNLLAPLVAKRLHKDQYFERGGAVVLC